MTRAESRGSTARLPRAPHPLLRGRSLTLSLGLSLMLATAACSPVVPSLNPGGTGPAATPSGSTVASATPATPATTGVPTSTGPAADVALEVIARGLSTPIGIVAPPGDSGRLFVVEQTGRIWILEDGELRDEPFLDLDSRLVALVRDYDERGLLGLAFDPDFASNGRFFVYYGAPLGRAANGVEDHLNRLSELHVSATDPNRADPDSERTILEISQPQPNHSGGGLGFGPDGYLYLGVGDGGGTGDASEGQSEQGHAQDLTKHNGKILRIDVALRGGAPAAGDDPYRIPGDNPFAEGGGRPEIYAYGFRNPWRLGWESDGAQRLLVSDVGYGRWEELDVVTNGSNYGWRVREGAHCLDVAAPLTNLLECDLVDDRGEPLVDPVLEYAHGEVGVAIVAGYTYRGSAIPALAGRYVFADWSHDWTDNPIGRGSLLVAEPAAGDGEPWPWRRLEVEGREGGSIGRFVTGLGEDADGEIYVLARTVLGPSGTTGEILKLVPPG